MKTNELMLGDWVLVERYEGIYGGPVWKQAGKVNGIFQEEAEIRFSDEDDDDEFIYSYPSDGIEPIPLTPEILEKNGFNYEETHDVWILEYGEIIIEVGVYHPDFINISYKQMTPDGIIEGDISSISKFDGSDIMTHELQHALRLVGIEKEIEL